MILVADSGSTKCDWLLETPGSSPRLFHTMGFNPLFHDADFIAGEIQKNTALSTASEKIKAVYYYGASVSSEERTAIVVKALKSVFTNADVFAEHDLTGAVRATCGDNPGIACILGTGSNSCYFNGLVIDDHIPALGYILGDEAGGADFGKRFLQLFLYHKLPENVAGKLKSEGLSREEIFRRVYKEPGANVYLASFMKQISLFRNEPVIQKMLHSGFRDFLEIHVKPFELHNHVPVHFVGSVGFNFKAELQHVCESMNIHTGIFTNEPVWNLFHYHINKNKHAEL